MIAYNQAYYFSHFSSAVDAKTAKAEDLSIFGKLKVVITGISIPKPKNTLIPPQEYSTLRLEGEESIECWFIEQKNAKGTVILFHGYTGNKSDLISYSNEWYKMGYSTCLVDFRASGGSSGTRCTIGFDESKDVHLVYQYFKENYPHLPIYLHGSSMGAVAIMRAIHTNALNVKGIILECPFESMNQTTQNRFEAMGLPSFPLVDILLFYGGIHTGFSADEHVPREYARSIEVPTLLLYGELDTRVKRSEIDAIYANLAGEKYLTTFPNSGHANYLNHSKKEWLEVIQRFIN